MRLIHAVSTIIATASLVAAIPAVAAEDDWPPAPPASSTYDWMQTTSGEWLKGELISMYDDTVEFDSDEFGLLTVDWSDVRQIHSAGVMQLAFENGVIVVGRLVIDPATIRVSGDDEQTFDRKGVLSITSGAPKEINYWTINAGIGANLRRGNTEQVETTGKVRLVRRTPKNRINIDALATFNRTDGETAADSQRAAAGWNRFFSRRFYWSPIYGEWYRDPFANIGQRWTLGMGAGYELIDTPKISWTVTAGLGYQATRFDSVTEGEPETADTPALIGGTIYDHELTGWLDYRFDYSFQIVNTASGSYMHHLETGLSFDLTSLLDFDVTVIWDRIEDPQPSADGVVPEQDDVRLVVFVGFDF